MGMLGVGAGNTVQLFLSLWSLAHCSLLLCQRIGAGASQRLTSGAGAETSVTPVRADTGEWVCGPRNAVLKVSRYPGKKKVYSTE